MDIYNNMFKLSSSIYTLHDKLADLEIKGEFNSLEYNKIIDYLEICLEYENRLYNNLDLETIGSILSFIDEDEMNISDNLYKYNKTDFVNSRIYNKLININKIISVNNNELDSFYNKLKINNTINAEFAYYYLFILYEYMKKTKSNKIKSKLIDIKYKLSFINNHIEEAMHFTNFRLDIPVLRYCFSFEKSLKKRFDLYNYNKEILGEEIFKNEMKKILEEKNTFSLVLHECALRASMMMIDDDNKLADLNDSYHKYLKENEITNSNEKKITSCFIKNKVDRLKHFVYIR